MVIKADVRGSTDLTKDLLERGLNPASHFSMNLHEPVKRMLEHYGAAKVFIEGDAIILAIYEHESTRTTQRARRAGLRAGARNSGGDQPLQRAREDQRACRRSNSASASRFRIPRRRSGWTATRAS